VHDIGKNLVDIILRNNGYEVHNIGIKQPIDAILRRPRSTASTRSGCRGCWSSPRW
jgi:5-methyltetrahydrofolate--homocysteine methyltransferase